MSTALAVYGDALPATSMGNDAADGLTMDFGTQRHALNAAVPAVEIR